MNDHRRQRVQRRSGTRRNANRVHQRALASRHFAQKLFDRTKSTKVDKHKEMSRRCIDWLTRRSSNQQLTRRKGNDDCGTLKRRQTKRRRQDNFHSCIRRQTHDRAIQCIEIYDKQRKVKKRERDAGETHCVIVRQCSEDSFLLLFSRFSSESIKALRRSCRLETTSKQAINESTNGDDECMRNSVLSLFIRTRDPRRPFGIDA